MLSVWFVTFVVSVSGFVATSSLSLLQAIAVSTQPGESRVQTEVYLDLDDGIYYFCTLIAENGQYLRAVGQYYAEAAEGNAKFFQRVLDSVVFSTELPEADETV